MSRKYQLSFSKKYRKLDSPTGFKTVRWPDAVYPLGKALPVVFCPSSKGRYAARRYMLGTARITKIELEQLAVLLAKPQFSFEDADCSVDDYIKMMQGWYSGKPDWKGTLSYVQLLTCQWLTKGEEHDFNVQKQLVETTL